MSIIIVLIIGAIAGLIAGLIVKGWGHGMLMNIFIGIIGAVIGGFVFSMLGFTAAGGFIGLTITAAVGSVLLLFVLNALA